MATARVTINPGEIKNSHISNNSADRIEAAKLEHVHRAWTNFGLAIGDTPTTKEVLVFVAENACTVEKFSAMLDDTGTTTDIDFDLQKNGTSILSSVLTITNTDTDGEELVGTLGAGVALAAGDRLSIAMTVNTSTGAKGPFAQACVTETGEPVE